MAEDTNMLIKERIRKHDELVERGVNPYAYSFPKSHEIKDLLSKYEGLEPEKHSGDKVAIAGRIMTLRRMGKATFLHLLDQSGKMQVYFRQDDMDKELYKLLKKADMGDFIGVHGEVFATKTGEISVYAKEWVMLTKAIRPLPEKYHGLKDTELRYRKRYLDLIVNPEEREKFRMRTKIIGLVREFLNGKDFLEVETPVLQTIYGGTNAKPFLTHINAYDMQMYLRVAPELYLKRLLIGGYEKVYEIARNFRNEGVDQTHNPEFTMIEWYEAYSDYQTMMDRAEAMFKFIAKSLFGKEEITVHDKVVDISTPWPRITMQQAIKKYLGLDVAAMSDDELKSVVIEKKLTFLGEASRGQLIFTIFDKLVCDMLLDPVWIIDYPKEISPLAKQHRDNPAIVERFEGYIGGKEISDGWSELTNPIEQRRRFEVEQAAMQAGNDEAHPKDEEFIEAMEYGMPPAGGIGIGIDRMVMLFTNCWSIRDVLFFPTMKPLQEEEQK
ncbi:lysine--tRNA ligase [Candidatus Woesearchaeota archaeon]|nr:lysine--tRNA ligase [Candidatus Woesearchaeota archaeon]